MRGLGDDDARVLDRAAHFLGLMSELTQPQDFCFHAFDSKREDVGALAATAARVATGTGHAPASLTIRPGEVPSFRMTGAHAVATIREGEGGHATRTRLVLIATLVLVVVAVLCMLR
jgi:hypothetical protein